MSLTVVASILSTIATPITSILTARNERKMAKDSLRAKSQLAKSENQTKVELTDAEWEIAAKKEESWKDEYVTVSIVSVFNLLIAGGIYGAFSQDYRLLEGVVGGIEALHTLEVDVGFLLTATVLAAIGLKVWRA